MPVHLLLLLLLLLATCSKPKPVEDYAALSDEALKQGLVEVADSDPMKIGLINEQAYRLIYEDSGRADSLANLMLVKAADLEWPAEMAKSHIVLGHLATEDARFDDAEGHYQKALDIRKKLGDKEGVASCYNSLGNLYSDSSYQEAEKYYRAGLEVVRHLVETDILPLLHNNLGAILTKLGKYDEAFRHLHTGLEMRKQKKDQRGIAYSQLNIGVFYQKKGEPEKSIAPLRESLKIAMDSSIRSCIAKCYMLLGNVDFYALRYREALEKYEKASAYYSALSRGDRARLLRNQASSYAQLGQLENAWELYRKAGSLFQELKAGGEVAAINFDLGNMQFESLHYDSAEYYFRAALLHVDTNDVQLRARIADNLHWTLRRLGRYEESLQYYDDNRMLEDSLKVKVSRADLLKEAIDRERLEASMKRYTTLGVSGFILVALLLIIAFLFGLTQQQKRKLAYQEIDHLLYQQELEISRTREETEEQERRRIGRDLHDRIGAMLAAVKMYFDELDRKIDLLALENRERYDRAIHVLDEVCTEVRGIAHNLQSDILEKFGLKAELEAFANKLRDLSNLEVELTTFGLQERLEDRQLEIHISCIIRELAANAIKFAKATRLSIQVNRFANKVNLIVEDDGIGFRPREVQKKGGTGLRGLTDRVHGLQGTMHIDSLLGKGTSIAVDIPLKD